jgi:Fe-S cluster biogenesis protein NfuA/nitrite reductase/ring-hydroxylating ferredoxin subunit
VAAEPSTADRARGSQDEQLIARVQELTARLESVSDPVARDVAEQLTAAVVQMYGAGLERIVDAIADAGPAGAPIRDALVDDGVVASLLLIHDLYPIPIEERVREALERVRPYMESHGGNVELLAITDGVARLRLQGSCRSCAASSATLELAVRQALEDAAPDLQGMDVEGVAEPEPTGVSLPLAGNGDAPAGFELPIAGAAPRAPSWFDVDGVGDLAPERLVAAEVAGSPLVIANVEGTLLAYRNSCASCSGRLDDGELAAGALACPSCGRSFFLPRAGRSLDDDRLQLEPIPLLREQGSVRVALPA